MIPKEMKRIDLIKIKNYSHFLFNLISNTTNINNPKSLNPIRCNYAITYKCNSKCLHCDIWKVNKEHFKNELSVKDIKNLFNKSKRLNKLSSIGITGGEPFIREDLVDILQAIYEENKVEFHIPTNGLLTDKIYSDITKILKFTGREKVYLYVSVDGLKDTNNHIRGINGSFDRAIKTVESLKEHISVGISFTISHLNYKEILDVYNLSKKLGVGFGLRTATNSSIYYNNSDKKFVFSKNQLDDIDFQINLITRDIFRFGAINPGLFFISNIVNFENEKKRLVPCYSGRTSFYLDPYGNIYPCILLNKKLGNIKEADFDYLWNNKSSKETREIIEDGKCACHIECETCNSISLDFNMLLKWTIKRNINYLLKIGDMNENLPNH